MILQLARKDQKGKLTNWQTVIIKATTNESLAQKKKREKEKKKRERERKKAKVAIRVKSEVVSCASIVS